MKQVPTLFLKFVVVLMAIGVLGLCIFTLPPLISSERAAIYRPILIGMYIPAIPFFLVLYQALKLLGYIDTNTAFSDLSIKALKRIKYSALTISILYAMGMPYIYQASVKDNAPEIAILGLILMCGPLVVTMFASVFGKLLQQAIDIKSENDLTV
jgi:CDP-diglyceride synthetase